MIDSSYESYTSNPAKFVREILGNDVEFNEKGKQISGNYKKQNEILDSVVHNKRTAVVAPNGVGKSISAAQIILWATSLFKDCTVITTAGSGRQVESLWVEVNRMYSRCPVPLGGDILQKQLRFKALKSLAYGFSTNKPEKFEGWHCLTPDHEVLTDRGFVPISEVTTSDMVLSLKTLTSEASWRPVTDVYAYDVQDQWVNEYNGKSVSFCVTDEHRMVTKSKPGRRGWTLKPFDKMGVSFMVRRLCEWKTYGKYEEAGYRMPEVFKAMKFSPEQYASFVGWWVAEGNVHWTKRKLTGEKVYYSVTINQSKESGRAELRELLAGVKHVEYPDRFVISNRKLGAWLIENCGTHSENKHIPLAMMNAKTPLIQALFNGLMGGDGSTKSSGAGMYYTTSKVLRDQVQELSIKLGRPGTCGLNKPKTHIGKTKQVCYTVSIGAKGRDHRASKHKVVRKKYTGKVHCLSTPFETFLVRRNGRVFFSGNSKRILVILDEAKGIQQNIFDASERLLTSGYWVRQLVISSPGSPTGPFYDCFGKFSKLYNLIRIKMGESPYVDPAQMELLKFKYGETSPFYLSTVMGEFSGVDDPLVVIPLSFVYQALDNPPEWDNGKSGACAGIDLAAGGGDECAYSLMVGNRQMAMRRWVEPNTMESTGKIIRFFKEDREKYGLESGAVNIDDGTFGHAVIDRLHELGYPFNRFNFGGSPTDNTAYYDASAEVWYETRMRLERKEIGLLQTDDESLKSTIKDLQNQLTARKRLARSDGRIQLEPKKIMKKRTHCSPDLADAFVLSAAGKRGVELRLENQNRRGADEPPEEKDPEKELKEHHRIMQERADKIREEREANG